MAATKDITLDLKCDLTETELQERGLQMSSCVLAIDDCEREKKEANKTFGERLTTLRGEMRRLSNAIRNRFEWRPVTCVVEFHSPVQGSKRISRRDTGEFVRDEPMSAFEMQENLFTPAAAEETSEAKPESATESP